MTYQPPRVLIADDEESVRQVLQRILQRDGYDVDTASTGQQALEMLRQGRYDLLLVDLKMTPVDGLQVLRAAKAQDEDIVVIILTGHASLESAVAGLRLGAFDYLLKPASPEEILQCVDAGVRRRLKLRQRRQLLEQIEMLKRTLEVMDEDVLLGGADRRMLQRGPLTLDRHKRSAVFAGKRLDLTTAEFDILVCLVQFSPLPVSAEKLVQCALGYDASPVEARELVKWHIHRLRRKIEPDPASPHYIKTVRGRGYLWAA